MSPEGSVSTEPSVVLANQTTNVTFTCGGMGGPDNTFQWSCNGQDLSGETSPSLTIANITASDGGNYRCKVSNRAGFGSSTSVLIGVCCYNHSIFCRKFAALQCVLSCIHILQTIISCNGIAWATYFILHIYMVKHIMYYQL